jgi:glycosyltransferase involved in cell wall biosynthesis
VTHRDATRRNGTEPAPGEGRSSGVSAPSVVVATIFREGGETGVHTHFGQLRGYLERHGTGVDVVTPFSWNRTLTYPVFAPRLVLRHVSPPAAVLWYRYWHEVFLYRALRQRLADGREQVVYAQGPLEARAALRARRNPRQRVIMAVHFRASQADEHAEPGRELKRDGALYRAMRRAERDVILHVDGLVYVSGWARDALLGWLPEAADVPSEVIGNGVKPVAAPVSGEREGEPGQLADLVTIGRLDEAKNHRFLLDVLAEARRKERRVTLDIYGDGPLRRDLARRISSLDLDGQVRLLGFRADVRQQLPAYRAYAHASYAETSSLAIIEAMAAGLPIVAAGIGPIPELCKDGAEARFWPLDDPARAAATLLELLDSPSALAAAANAARARFERDFDIDVVGARLRSFLLESPAEVPAQPS